MIDLSLLPLSKLAFSTSRWPLQTGRFCGDLRHCRSVLGSSVTLAVSQANLSLLCTQKFRFCDYPGNHPQHGHRCYRASSPNPKRQHIIGPGAVKHAGARVSGGSAVAWPFQTSEQRIRLRICAIAKCLFFKARMRRDHRGLPDAHPGRVSLIGWTGTVTPPFDANSGRWQQGAETAASSH
jgi:hypothetical protein